MVTIYSQTESELAVGRNLSDRRSLSDRLGTNYLINNSARTADAEPARKETSFAPLILSVLLRDHLSDHDRVELDRIAPPRCITFLIKGREYLHPEQIELFPYDLIESAVLHHENAVFSHIFRPSSDGNSRKYRIATALINPCEEQPLVFGFMGPDHILSADDQENKFHEIVSRFRIGYRQAAEMKAAVDSRLSQRGPVLLVNRSSGRVIYASQAAADLSQSEQRTLLGLEFHEVRSMIPNLKKGDRFQIKNVTRGELSLALISLTSADLPNSEKYNSTDFLSHTIADKIENLIRVTEDFNSSDQTSTIGARTELLSGLTSVRSGINMLQQLHRPDGRKKVRTNVLLELDRAISGSSSWGGQKYPVRLVNRGRNLYLSAPPGSLQSVFTAVLQAHLAGNISSAGSTIKIEQDKTEATIRIAFSTSYREGVKDDWHRLSFYQLAEELCAMEKYQLSSETSADNTKVLTRIRISASNKSNDAK